MNIPLGIKCWCRGISAITIVIFATWTCGCSRYADSTNDDIMHPSKISDYQVWENSMGMRFVNVTKLENVWFSVWPTRVKDFRMFVNDDIGNKGYNYFAGEQPNVLTSDGWIQQGWEYTWDNPNFKQSDNHPVVSVSWQDAKAFCEWLTQKERAEGVISSNMVYRLPSDWEWSIAIGLEEVLPEGSPKDRDQKISDIYPWGTTYPPPPNWSNYAGKEARNNDWPFNVHVISGWSDAHARTSPVGAYGNKHQGLSDMSGNVNQWCSDLYGGHRGHRTLRGASWSSGTRRELLSSTRLSSLSFRRGTTTGFRVVLERDRGK